MPKASRFFRKPLRKPGSLDWVGSSGREKWMGFVTFGKLLHLSKPT